MLFGRKQAEPANGSEAWLVVGLGNPGTEYARNRHNVGFRVLDELAHRKNARLDQKRFRSQFGTSYAGGLRVHLLKPQTYVNASGEAVGPAARFYHLRPERVLVVCDDIDLPFARIRVRPGGSSGGHNGLKSIAQALGNRQDFPRVRIGVGRPPHDRDIVVGHVLEDFSALEEQVLPEVISDVCDAIDIILEGDIDRAMDRYNGVRRAG